MARTPKDPRNERAYTFTFDSIEEKNAALAYAEKVKRPLAQIIREYLRGAVLVKPDPA